MAGIAEFKQCLVCASHDLSALAGYEMHFLIRCKNCGFVFCKKIPKTEELELHYGNYNREHYLSPITVRRFNEFLDTFERFKETNRILDIGCGNGFFLEEAKKRGWDVYGTEFSDAAVQICQDKGIKMKKGALDRSWFEPGFFDIIISLEVIEHINNPVEEIQNIKELLRSGGLFFFTTPNFNAVERFLLKEKYTIIEYPEHLSYYTASTADRLLKHNGFTKLRIQTTGVSLTRLTLRKEDQTEQIVSKHSNDEVLRTKIDQNFLLKVSKHSINKLLDFLKIGNSLKGWYIKN